MHTDAMTLEPKVAVITGAGSGIGRAVAVTLRAHGYNVVLAGRRLDELEKTAGLKAETANEQSARSPGQAITVQTDVTSETSVADLFAQAGYCFGRIDVLFNNAGAAAPAIPLDELGFDQWKAVVDVNLNGAFLCAAAAMRAMKKQKPHGGRIINNGSISAISPRPLSAPYTATKHAITGLTKSISLDGRAHDIACSQIDIGNAATELTERMAAGIAQANGTLMVEPRIDVQLVADAVLYIANLPLSANVQFMTLMATKMPLIGRG